MSSKMLSNTISDARWDAAIAFAEAELERLHARRKRLMKAVRLLRQNRDQGAPWPEGVRPEGAQDSSGDQV